MISEKYDRIKTALDAKNHARIGVELAQKRAQAAADEFECVLRMELPLKSDVPFKKPMRALQNGKVVGINHDKNVILEIADGSTVFATLSQVLEGMELVK